MNKKRIRLAASEYINFGVAEVENFNLAETRLQIVEKIDSMLEEKYGLRAIDTVSYYYDIINENKFLLFQLKHSDTIAKNQL